MVSVIPMIIPYQRNFVPTSHIPKEAELCIRELGQYDNDPLRDTEEPISKKEPHEKWSYYGSEEPH